MTTDDTSLRETLRTLDPSTADLSDAQRRTASAALERILATAPGTPKRKHRRLALAAATACAVAVGGFTFFHTGDDGQAYASWTPSPQALTEQEVSAVAGPCKRHLRGGSIDVKKAHLFLAERRGEFVMVLYRTDNPDMSGQCFVRNPVGTDNVDVISAGGTGSSGPSQQAPPGALMEGGFAQFEGASITDGAVGPDVVGLTIHAGKYTASASIKSGHYAVWWPGPAFTDEKPPESGQWSPTTIVTYDLTLTDGTVLTDVQPTRPS